jgi:hypothetical protein
MGRSRATGGGLICSRPTGRLSDRWRISRFKGVLHVDGYAGFERLTGSGDIVLAACWAHTRRKFYEVAEATGSPVAAEALRRIGELYAVEARVRRQSSAHRLAERRSFSRPIVQALNTWLEAQLPRLHSGRASVSLSRPRTTRCRCGARDARGSCALSMHAVILSAQGAHRLLGGRNRRGVPRRSEADVLDQVRRKQRLPDLLGA